MNAMPEYPEDLTNEAIRETNVRRRAWIRSDEGFDMRLAVYIFEALNRDQDAEGEPEHPAIRGYAMGTDQIVWRACSNPTTIKDYMRGVDGAYCAKVNAAAMALITNA